MEKNLSVDVKTARRFFWDLSGSPYSVRNYDRSALSPQDDAAITMQKTYRGYRRRRQLADCAVIARDYGWWNVLEGVILRQNIEFDQEREENVSHKWIRAKKLAAKLGKGLSKDENARKLAFEHWLEAIDARHRYGHNLHKFYKIWFSSGTTEPFFYWLDVGEGRQVEHEDCSRAKLFKEQIDYLGPRQRKEYEVSIENGVWRYLDGKIIDTGVVDDDDKWIFVMSTTGRIYVGQKKKGKFQHSSFLAGGAATAAGRLVLMNGILELLEAHSGHYRPAEEDFRYFLNTLKDKGVDMSRVKVEYSSREMKSHKQKSKKKLPKANKDSVSDEAASLATTFVEALSQEASKPEETPSLLTHVDVNGNECNGNGDLHKHMKHRPPMLEIKRNGWCSEGGARITSLSVIPPDRRTRALDAVSTPRVLATVRW
ncbi:IQ domain-containing protein IQM1-like [Selaginella moellendorffii]|uniref:IQ domain-containing protein IQM1-like n=1 Tax=Selaginella moellendorffii TaxID=88036 RepID=UPI000D1C67AC|nr:IQ domain-containing protein IQM1-like [Selaginella moellendorffii]|eukprot:XP_024520420.1 IQ domain-containing protein IQM1-like [Selaginella moellendorffii]